MEIKFLLKKEESLLNSMAAPCLDFPGGTYERRE